MSRPPPSDLLKRIARAKAEVAKRETERKAAFSCEGHAFVTHLLVCNGYHERFRLWQLAVTELRQLERQLAAHQAHAAEAVAHE